MYIKRFLGRVREFYFIYLINRLYYVLLISIFEREMLLKLILEIVCVVDFIKIFCRVIFY